MRVVRDPSNVGRLIPAINVCLAQLDRVEVGRTAQLGVGVETDGLERLEEVGQHFRSDELLDLLPRQIPPPYLGRHVQ